MSTQESYAANPQPSYVRAFTSKPGPDYRSTQEAAARLAVDALYRNRASERSSEVPDSDLLGFSEAMLPPQSPATQRRAAAAGIRR